MQILAYVVMSDHVHLMVVPGHLGLSDDMRILKGRFARHLNHESGRRGSLWQERFYESVVRTDEQMFGYIDYIHNNPVEAGLCERPEDWPYTSARQSGGPDLARFLNGEQD